MRLLHALALSLALPLPHAFAEDLPKPEAPFAGVAADTREKSTPAFPDAVKAPKGAPNVILILLDDVGFAASSTFGGAAATPELDKLASQGVRYNQFHTTAICSPTRAALLTGRNHHQTGFGNLVPAGYPAYNLIWKKETASIAQVLRLNGYSTVAFGKWHNTPVWEISPAGPFDHWPTGLGFEYFYGFMAGETSQWEPQLYRNTVAVEPTKTPAQGYHFTSDIVDDAVKWLHNHESVAPEKPFFLYLATGATHAPHHVPQEWIDKYKGQFDQGWDKLREENFARQKALGVIPANAELTPRPEGLPAWDSLSPDQKKLYAHQMEVYSAFLSHTDHEVGRLLKTLDEEGRAKDTLVLYIVGDNGGSAEGGLNGSDANLGVFQGANTDVAFQLQHLSDLGSPLYDNHYAAGWSWATTTPFQWMKQIASHFGGTRNPLVVSWPGHVAQSQAIRSQFGHVNDIAPTIYAAAGVAFPDKVEGVAQTPLEGKSLLPSFTDPQIKSAHTEQYFEIFGNRAIYKDGWVAGARRYRPWEMFTDITKVFRGGFENDKWELYHVEEDFSQAHDLAEKNPEKLAELKAEFDKEARRNGVYPLVPIPEKDKLPLASVGKTHFVFYDGVDRLPAQALPDIGARSHRITAIIDNSDGKAEGVIIADGGRHGGFSLYVKDGRLIYVSNLFGQTLERVVGAPLPKGKSTVVYTFDVDFSLKETAKGLISAALIAKARPGQARLSVNGEEVASEHLSAFGGFNAIGTETLDIGKDLGSPVSPDYQTPFAFTGKIEKVELDLK
ncbi:arylsulfatase [Rhodoblastus acidophilus]|uniref:Arylsulfatase n=1 Tax=Rhodoblastus acidophilus TaxID=1074 RepID=A0A212PZM6_RHOAC|nr:arylsulfatase [Rhodoblastus acidophilus]PPQ36585.1 arylsulfatase [Rhodoblastus acidophilus]RAI17829.1 arylsulfatase [Rhodoblastus acidophilus]SNB52398.1 arylsulfatase [Rhodoblastus acidophilus]